MIPDIYIKEHDEDVKCLTRLIVRLEQRIHNLRALRDDMEKSL